MMVIDDLLTNIVSADIETPARDVSIGLYWTAVLGQRMGLAATMADATCCFSTDVGDVGRLHTCSLNELAQRLRSAHPLEVTIGLAALNALIEVGERDGVETNARDVILERGRGKNVVTVGHFPFTDALREVARQSWVLELNPGPGDTPADAAPEVIPQADVIGLTASTLLNGTFDALTKLFPPQALVVMLGPSTPLSGVLFDYGVHMLGGVLVDDPQTVLNYVRQGTSMHRVPGLRRFTMMKV